MPAPGIAMGNICVIPGGSMPTPSNKWFAFNMSQDIDRIYESLIVGITADNTWWYDTYLLRRCHTCIFARVV